MDVQDLLGEGQVSSVVRCTCGRSATLLAVKMYHKSSMTLTHCQQVL